MSLIDELKEKRASLKLSSNQVNEFWRTKEFSHDIVLIFNDRKFFFHKKLLEIRSPMFFSMFELDWKEKNMKIITLENPHEIPTDTFEFLYEYIYNRETAILKSLPWNSIKELYYLSNFFLFDRLKLDLTKFMMKSLRFGSVEGFVKIISLSAELSDLKLFKSCMSHFSFLKSYCEFVRAMKDKKELFEFVMESELLCINEKYVYYILQEWIRVQEIEKKENIIEVFKMLRFDILNPSIAENIKYDMRKKYGLFGDDMDKIHKVEKKEYILYKNLPLTL